MCIAFDYNIIYTFISLDNTTCGYHVTSDDLLNLYIHLVIYNVILIVALYHPGLHHTFRNIFFTLWMVEFLAQYVVFLNLGLTIDIFTVYLCIWQLTSLTLNWVWLHLLPPILIIEQSSYCMVAALIAWVFHFIFIRYIPPTISLLWLWVFAIIDM